MFKAWVGCIHHRNHQEHRAEEDGTAYQGKCCNQGQEQSGCQSQQPECHMTLESYSFVAKGA